MISYILMYVKKVISYCAGITNTFIHGYMHLLTLNSLS